MRAAAIRPWSRLPRRQVCNVCAKQRGRLSEHGGADSRGRRRAPGGSAGVVYSVRGGCNPCTTHDERTDRQQAQARLSVSECHEQQRRSRFAPKIRC